MVDDRKILFEVGDGPEGITIYESDAEGVNDWSPILPALYVMVSTNGAFFKAGPFTLGSIRKQLLSKLKE